MNEWVYISYFVGIWGCKDKLNFYWVLNVWINVFMDWGLLGDGFDIDFVG